jgi:TolB-like protein
MPKSLFAELRRRNVFKVAAAYAIVAWLLIQVANNLAPVLSLPEWAAPFVVFMLILGFPVALLLAWAYEVTPDGIKLTKHVPLRESLRHLTGQRLNYFVTGLLVLAVGFLLIDDYLFDRPAAQDAPVLAASASDSPVEGRSQPAVGSDRTRGLRADSIAVIPCDSLSNDPEDANFAAGVHEEILNQLVRLRRLNVISRTTMLRYADSSLTIPEIGRELDVRTILECSVRRAGNRVLVTAQLIDAESDLHLWSNSYQHDLTDVFAIQADIATNVTRELQLDLSPEDRARLPRQAPTDSREAYELYLAARGRSTGGDAYAAQLETLERIDRALTIDPEFAAAWTLKSNAHAILSGVVPEATTQLAAAVNAALRAIAADPTAPEARAMLSAALAQQGEWRRAEQEFQRAVELGAVIAQNPFSSIRQMAVGDFAGARATLEANQSVDPMNHISAGFLLMAYEVLGDSAARRAAFARGENVYGAWFGQTIDLLLRIGDRDREGLRAFESTSIDAGTIAVTRTAQPFLDSPSEGALALRGFFGALEEPTAVQLMFAGAWAGYFNDDALAAEFIAEATQRQQAIAMYLWLPAFAKLRPLPAFKDIVRDLGLVEYWQEFGWPPFCRLAGMSDFECA